MGVHELVTWGALIVVLLLIATGRFRIDLVALGGLLALGMLGVAPTKIVFSGFGHPALATIIAVFLVSESIIQSELMRGLGQSIARRIHTLRGQALSLAAAGAFLSALMNNVGAVGLMIPTAVRMARRFNSPPGAFGLPLAMASLLGGSLTLIGSAPNIIIASYMYTATGQSFKMFDFAPHGLAMLGVALLIWLICKRCGLNPGATNTPIVKEGPKEEGHLEEAIPFAPLSTRERQITLLLIGGAVLLVSLGILHPSLGFGGAVLLLILTGVLKLPEAYQSVDLTIVFFLGAMLGMGSILEHTGSLELLSQRLAYFATDLSPFFLLVVLVFVSSALSNGINNAAAAVFMAPLAVTLAETSSLEVAAALMAVAAGSNMTLLLPTHQAVLMVMSRAPFSIPSFIKAGLLLTISCGLAAATMISLVWQ